MFPKERVAVFVDGCFWHGCPVHGSLPKTNTVFWRDKISRNVMRDKLVRKQLRLLKWTVVRVWQHELSDNHRVARRIQRVLLDRS